MFITAPKVRAGQTWVDLLGRQAVRRFGVGNFQRSKAFFSFNLGWLVRGGLFRDKNKVPSYLLYIGDRIYYPVIFQDYFVNH